MPERDAAWWTAKMVEVRGNRSVEAFAREVGVSSKTVWRWEHGAVPSHLAQERLRRKFPSVFGAHATAAG